MGPTILRKHLDDVPLWSGDHVAVKQLVEHFARYLYLPRLAGPEVLAQSISDGIASLTWAADTFAFAESYDEAAGRYRGLRGGQMANVSPESPGFLVKADVARRQLEAEVPSADPGSRADPRSVPPRPGSTPPPPPPQDHKPTRFYGTVALDPARVGRDASRIAEEVIAHLTGLVGANVRVTLEIEAEVPSGAPDSVVRTVTENSVTLKFANQGFETE